MDTSPANCSGFNEAMFSWKQLSKESMDADANVTLNDILSQILNSSVDPACLFTERAGGNALSTVKRLTLALSSVAVLANMLSLLAIYNIKKKLNANLRLIVSLCAADLLVGLCFLVLSSDNRLVQKGSTSYGFTCLGIVLRSIRNGIHIATLFNLLGLALDHYYAIVRTLYYRAVMNTQRVTWMITGMWGLSFLLSFSDLYIPSAMFDHCKEPEMSLCDRAECTVYNSELLVFVITLLTFILLLYFYISIFVTLRKHNSILVRHRLIMQKKKQGTVTTILILGTFVIFWIPYCLFDMIVNFMTITHLDYEKVIKLLQIYIKINFYLYDILLLNSVCDPIIYAWRMRDVQRGYQHILNSITCYKYHIKESAMAHYRKSSFDSVTQLKLTTVRRKMPLCYQGSHLSEESTTAMNHSYMTTPTLKTEVFQKPTIGQQLSSLDLRRIPEHQEGDTHEEAAEQCSSLKQFHLHSLMLDDHSDTILTEELVNQLLVKQKSTSLPKCNSNTCNCIHLKPKHLSTSSSDPNLSSMIHLSDVSSTSHSLPALQNLVVTSSENRKHGTLHPSLSVTPENCDNFDWTNSGASYGKSSFSSMPNAIIFNENVQDYTTTQHRNSLPSFWECRKGFCDHHNKACSLCSSPCNGYKPLRHGPCNSSPEDTPSTYQHMTVHYTDNTSTMPSQVNKETESRPIYLTSPYSEGIIFNNSTCRQCQYHKECNCPILRSETTCDDLDNEPILHAKDHNLKCAHSKDYEEGFNVHQRRKQTVRVSQSTKTTGSHQRIECSHIS